MRSTDLRHGVQYDVVWSPNSVVCQRLRNGIRASLCQLREVRNLVGVCRSAMMVRFHAFGDDVR